MDRQLIYVDQDNYMSLLNQRDLRYSYLTWIGRYLEEKVEI